MATLSPCNQFSIKGHPLTGNYQIGYEDSTSLVSSGIGHQTFSVSGFKAPPLGLPPPVPVRTVFVKPSKTKAEIEADAKLKEEELQQELKKHIIKQIEDDYKDRTVNDSKMFSTKLKLQDLPAEDGNMVTYIINADEFDNVLQNDFKIMLVYMAFHMNTHGFEHQLIDNKHIWSFNRQCSEKEVYEAHLSFIDDMIRCRVCYCFVSQLTKRDNNLVQICSECSNSEIIEFDNSDNGGQNPSVIIDEILKLVPDYGTVTIDIERLNKEDYSGPARVETDESKTLMQKLEDVKNGKLNIPLGINSIGFGHWASPHINHQPYPYQYNPHTSHHNIPHHHNVGNSTFHHTHQPFNHTNGYPVTQYGNYFNKTDQNGSAGHSQHIVADASKFGFQPANDKRHENTYTPPSNNYKENFRKFAEYLNRELKEKYEPITINLITKAQDLNLENEAILVIMMVMFNEKLIVENQLVTKRAKIMPFINLNPDESGKYFLLGLEALIELCQETLEPDTIKILNKAYTLKYFTIKSLINWFTTENDFVTSSDWVKKFRASVEQFKNTLIETENALNMPFNNVIEVTDKMDTDDENDTDSSTSNESDLSDDSVVDYGVKHKPENIKFDTSLFQDIDIDKLTIDMLEREQLFGPDNINDDLQHLQTIAENEPPPLYTETAENALQYLYTDKMYTFENPYKSPYTTSSSI